MRRVMLLVAVVAMMPLHAVGGHAQTTPASDVFSSEGPWNITADSDGDALASMDLLGGSGSFSYNNLNLFGAKFCDFDSDGEPGPTDAEPGFDCTMSASGTFTSETCGTGSASGTGSLTGTQIGAGPGESGTFTFTITFTNFIGVLTGTFNDTGENDPDTLEGTVVFSESTQTRGVPDDEQDCANGFTAVWGMTGVEG